MIGSISWSRRGLREGQHGNVEAQNSIETREQNEKANIRSVIGRLKWNRKIEIRESAESDNVKLYENRRNSSRMSTGGRAKR